MTTLPIRPSDGEHLNHPTRSGRTSGSESGSGSWSSFAGEAEQPDTPDGGEQGLVNADRWQAIQEHRRMMLGLWPGCLDNRGPANEVTSEKRATIVVFRRSLHSQGEALDAWRREPPSVTYAEWLRGDDLRVLQ